MLGGIPELQELNMYGNKVSCIIVPQNPKILGRLETLNLGYNDVAYLPDELDQLTSLRTLKIMNNFLEKIPMRVCDMDLRVIDVSSNPVIQPPIETCERGIGSMKRYYQCLRMEEQTKQKALELEKKQKKKEAKKKASSSLASSSLASSLHCPVTRDIISKDEDKPDPVAKSDTPKLFEDTSLDSVLSVHSNHESSLPAFEMVPPQDLSLARQISAPASLPAAKARTLSVESVADDVYDATHDKVTVNDHLKVIFVGMAMVGKTSMIKRLIEGSDAVIPTHDERTIGVDIYEWDPTRDRRFEDIQNNIIFQDEAIAETCGDVDVKFSVWDFAGQHVYHATHELFFSSRALYVLVWDMGATNRETMRRHTSVAETGAFRLTYDSSDDEEEEEQEDQNGAFTAEEESRRADRALERDIDEKVQFWVDCIQSSAPGSAILPVASFSDYFENDGGDAEARRRCNLMQQRLLMHEKRRQNGIRQRLQELHDQNRADDPTAARLRKLLCDYQRPKLIFGDGDGDDSVVRVSGTRYTGFHELTEKVINIATGRDKGKWKYPIFQGHVGARIPRMRLEVREAVRSMRDRFKVVEWGYFISQLRDRGLTNVEDISDALHFLTSIGELSYFGGVVAGLENPVDEPVRNIQYFL
jgi:GTPase SAR1 family protein